MKCFEEEYKKDLIEINKRIISEDDERILKILIQDKNSLINNLYHSSTQFKYKSALNENQVWYDISSYKFYNISLKKIKNVKSDNYKLLNLFNKFLNKDEYKIKKIFENILSYDGIEFIESKQNFHCGSTCFIHSLNKNYIKIYKSKNECKNFSTLIHELGHAKINILNSTIIEKLNSNTLIEAYPIFLELCFSDWLKENGMLEESFYLKKEFLYQFKNVLMELYDELPDYLSYNEEQQINKYFFETKYIHFKGCLLAFEFYFNNLSNKEQTLEQIDKFIYNVKKMKEKSLLNFININQTCLNNNDNIKEFYEILKEEKEAIKQK